MWYHQWGEHVDRLEAIAATGQRVRTLEQRPEITAEIMPYFMAFYDLRPEGEPHSGTITWRSVSQYCDDLEIPDKEQMFDILRRAQNYFAKWKTSSSQSQPTPQATR